MSEEKAREEQAKDGTTLSECATCCEPRYFAVCDGFEVCTTCGDAHDGFIDMKHHWSMEGRTFAPNQSLTTFISKSGSTQNRRLQRIQQWNAVTPKEREMRQTVVEFASIQASLMLSSHIVDVAVKLYGDVLSRLVETEMHRCKRRSSLRAAAILFACKDLGVPRERKEIAQKLSLPLKNVTKCCNLFYDLMGQDFRERPPLSPLDFIERYCAILGVNDRAMMQDLIEAASRLNLLTNKTPTSVASACILFLINHLGLPVTKAEVQKKCGISSAIITRSYAVLTENKDEILADIRKSGSTRW